MKQIVRNIDSFWLKYSALNLLPIKELGSIEYRHMPGTLDIQKLLVWIDLISRIKIAAYKWTIEDLQHRIFALNTNSQYYHFLEDLFGSLVTYLDVNNLIRDMESNVFYVKHCAIVNDFHKKVITSSVPGSMLDPTQEIRAKILKLLDYDTTKRDLFIEFHQQWFPLEHPVILLELFMSSRNRAKWKKHYDKTFEEQLDSIFPDDTKDYGKKQANQQYTVAHASQSGDQAKQQQQILAAGIGLAPLADGY